MSELDKRGIGPLAVRTRDLGRRTAARDAEPAAEAPVPAILCERRATSDGIDASYLNQPIQLPELRPRLAAAAGVTGCPQLLLRLGRGQALPPAPRWPVDRVRCA